MLIEGQGWFGRIGEEFSFGRGREVVARDVLEADFRRDACNGGFKIQRCVGRG